MQQERDAVILISSDSKIVSRFKQSCEFLLFDGRHFSSIEEFFNGDYSRPRAIIIDMQEPLDEHELESIRVTYPRSEIMGIVRDLVQAKPQAYWYMDKTALEKTFLMEFFLFQFAFCEFYEIAPSDLFPETAVDFNAYHYLPLNQRYIPYVHSGFTLSQKRYKKIESLSSLYIHRKGSSTYIRYIERFFDRFSVGLRKRSRARVYQMLSSWREHMLRRNFTTEKQEVFSTILPDYKSWMEDFMEYIKSSENPWTMLFEISQIDSLQFECSFLETAIACYASKSLGDGQTERILNTKAVLSSQRLWQESLHFKKWWATGLAGLDEDEKKTWTSIFTSTKDNPRFQEADPKLKSDIITYHNQFIARAQPAGDDATLIHMYWGEIIAMTLLKMRKDGFNNKSLSEEVMVRCKADGLLNEAWMTELRQFLMNEIKKK